jgi:hypothetical protein
VFCAFDCIIFELERDPCFGLLTVLYVDFRSRVSYF